MHCSILLPHTYTSHIITRSHSLPSLSTPKTWIGTCGWTLDGWNSYVIMPTRTPVWSLDRTPTTNPYNPSVTPDVLNIVITKNISLPVYLTSCFALCSDTLLYSLILRVAHSFTTHRIDLTPGTLPGPTSKLTWKNQFRSVRNCTTR